MDAPIEQVRCPVCARVVRVVQSGREWTPIFHDAPDGRCCEASGRYLSAYGVRFRPVHRKR